MNWFFQILHDCKKQSALVKFMPPRDAGPAWHPLAIAVRDAELNDYLNRLDKAGSERYCRLLGWLAAEDQNPTCN